MVGGGSILFDAITSQVEKDLVKGELIALPISLLVMVLVFGGFLAAGMPIFGAIASIAGGLATLLGFSYLIDLDASVVNVVTVLGLGLCIDYGLLIVSRYREELRAQLGRPPPGRPGPPAPTRWSRRCAPPAGRCCSPGSPWRSACPGCWCSRPGSCGRSARPGSAWSSSRCWSRSPWCRRCWRWPAPGWSGPGLLNKIPGLRKLTGRFGDVAPEEGFFSRLARWTQRRPWLVVGGVLLILGILAAPALRMELRSSGAQLLPPSAPDRQFFDTLAEQYPASGHPGHPGGRRGDAGADDPAGRGHRGDGRASSWCRRRGPVGDEYR